MDKQGVLALIASFEKAVEVAMNEMDCGSDYRTQVRADAERDRIRAELVAAVKAL